MRKFSNPVLVWRISEQDEKNLDRYEGFPRFCNKKNLRVNVMFGSENLVKVTAMVYLMTPKAMKMRKFNPVPSEYYYSILDAGYEDFGFDKEILRESLLESFMLMKDCRANQPTIA